MFSQLFYHKIYTLCLKTLYPFNIISTVINFDDLQGRSPLHKPAGTMIFCLPFLLSAQLIY